MKLTIFNVLVGICGSIAFAFLSKAMTSMSGPKWWLQLGLVFALCFLCAMSLETYRNRNGKKRQTNTVGSGNESDGNQDIQITDAIVSGSGDKSVGSSNFAKGHQDIKIDKVRL